MGLGSDGGRVGWWQGDCDAAGWKCWSAAVVARTHISGHVHILPVRSVPAYAQTVSQGSGRPTVHFADEETNREDDTNGLARPAFRDRLR